MTPRRPEPARKAKPLEPTVAAIVRQQTGAAWSRARELCAEGRVTVNGQRCLDSALRVPQSAEVVVDEHAPKLRTGVLPESAIVFLDRDVVVVDKPPGMLSVAYEARDKDTLVESTRILLRRMHGRGFDPGLGVVHRLDKDTSGVLVLARTQRAAAKLAELFRGREVHKLYWAAVIGAPQPLSGRIDLALSKQPGQTGERVRPDQEEGQRAITYYRTVEHIGRKASWLALRPETGRTHQLRAHCAALGTPILGDGKYGGAGAFLPGREVSRQLHLHARAIELPHPAGKTLRVSAPLPPHMVATWKFLGFSVSAGPANREEFEF